MDRTGELGAGDEPAASHRARPSITLGDTELTLVSDGEPLRLSGEALYGCPPGAGWGSYTPPDEDGGISVQLQVLLVKGPRITALVDTGVHPDEMPGRESDLPGRLAAVGVRPEDVEVVITTHAHLDHIGHNTRRAGGEWVPFFPEARYVIQQIEAGLFRTSDPAGWERYFGSIEAAGKLQLVHGDREVAPGLTCLATPGHTMGHQSVLVGGEPGGSAIFLGDLAVTKLHLENPDWHPEWSWSAGEERASKARITRLASELDAVLVFGHDPRVPWGRVARTSQPQAEGGGVTILPLSERGHG